jgi:hypothetical protein
MDPQMASVTLVVGLMQAYLIYINSDKNMSMRVSGNQL